MLKVAFRLTLSVGLFFHIPAAFATEEVAQGFTLDGRLYADSAATTPLADLVSLKIQILNQAQDCILYEETQSVNTTSSQGYYTIQVGQKMGPPAGKRSSGDSNNSLARVFSNSAVAFNGKQLSDGTTVCAYTPNAGHVRYMKITMTPSDGISRSTTTNMLIDSVPMALVAERAESLQGYTPAQFIQVNNTTSALTQGNLESIFTTTGVSRLGTLLSVAPTSYVQTGSNGSAALPTVAGDPGSGLTNGQIWFDSVAGKVKYYEGGAVKTVSSGWTAGSGVIYPSTLTDKIGIGKNNPDTELDVNGAATVQSSYEGISAYANSGAAYTIPDSSLNLRRINLNSNTTITLPAFTATSAKVFSLTLMLKQDATGSRTVTWAGNGADTIKWDSGAAPSISATANKITIIQLMKPSDETVWYGSMVWREN